MQELQWYKLYKCGWKNILRGFLVNRVHRVRTVIEGVWEGKQLGGKTQEKNQRFYIDLENAYETVWQQLRVYDVVGDLLCIQEKVGQDGTMG